MPNRRLASTLTMPEPSQEPGTHQERLAQLRRTDQLFEEALDLPAEERGRGHGGRRE